MTKWVLFTIVAINLVAINQAVLQAPPTVGPFGEMPPGLAVFLSALESNGIPNYMVFNMISLIEPVASGISPHAELISQNIELAAESIYLAVSSVMDMEPSPNTTPQQYQTALLNAGQCVGEALLEGFFRQIEIQMGCFQMMGAYGENVIENIIAMAECSPSKPDCPAEIVKKAATNETAERGLLNKKLNHLRAARDLLHKKLRTCAVNFEKSVGS